jgi:hypothetical protein
MRRFSVRTLMVLIVGAAAGLAALRDASEVWAGIMLTLVLLILGTAIFGAIYNRGRRRAGWLGLAVFGWGYFMLAFGPGFSSELGNRLPSTQLLIALNPRYTSSWLSSSLGTRVRKVSGSKAELGWDQMHGSWVIMGLPERDAPWLRAWAWLAGLLGTARPEHDPEQFIRIGNYMAVLAVGLVGGLIARSFEAYSARD